MSLYRALLGILVLMAAGCSDSDDPPPSMVIGNNTAHTVRFHADGLASRTLAPGETFTQVVSDREGDSFSLHVWSDASFLGVQRGTFVHEADVRVSESGLANLPTDIGDDPAEVHVINPSENAEGRLYLADSYVTTLSTSSHHFLDGPAAGEVLHYAVNLWSDTTFLGTLHGDAGHQGVIYLDPADADTNSQDRPRETRVSNDSTSTVIIYVAGTNPVQMEAGQTSIIPDLPADTGNAYHVNHWNETAYIGTQSGTIDAFSDLNIDDNNLGSRQAEQQGEVLFRNDSDYEVWLTQSGGTGRWISEGHYTLVTGVTTPLDYEVDYYYADLNIDPDNISSANPDDVVTWQNSHVTPWLIVRNRTPFDAKIYMNGSFQRDLRSHYRYVQRGLTAGNHALEVTCWDGQVSMGSTARTISANSIETIYPGYITIDNPTDYRARVTINGRNHGSLYSNRQKTYNDLGLWSRHAVRVDYYYSDGTWLDYNAYSVANGHTIYLDEPYLFTPGSSNKASEPQMIDN